MLRSYFFRRATLIGILAFFISAQNAIGQGFSADSLVQPPIKTFPQISEGIPVRSVIIILHKEPGQVIADSLETDAFYKAFGLRPGASFRQFIADMAIRKIEAQPDIRSANYELYNTELSGPLIFVLHVFFLKPGEYKTVAGKKGMLATQSGRDFPLIVQTDKAKLMFILNGGVGIFNEVNAFFGQGPAFTKGNPVATNPAGKGVRFWGEGYLEPGLAGIFRFGKSKLYGYGAATILASGRNTSDIYSEGPASYLDWERLYAGLLAVGIGKNQRTNIDVSYGRQFFQLNDGFLISKFSGSANAGPRGSVYLNSRTAFQKSAQLKIHSGKWMLQGYFLEPEELFKDKQSNTNYAGGGLTYNDNQHFEAGMYYIATTGGTSKYNTPQGAFVKKGMYIINPKLWIKNIAGTGLFFKSEYAYQSHTTAAMQANAWYAGLGLSKEKWKYRPSLFYRYAFMQGDDSLSNRFEKFDPILTGGLGNWVQGINFRKVAGNGNIISHRLELKSYFSKSWEVSLDYFLLQAHTASNIGALAPIAKLNGKTYGQELTLTSRYFLSNHFMLLTVFSHGVPGNAIKNAFTTPVYSWTSLQAALFMFF
jgi:hypothetical protein